MTGTDAMALLEQFADLVADRVASRMAAQPAAAPAYYHSTDLPPGINRKRFHAAARAAEFPATKRARCWYALRSDVHEWIARGHRPTPTAPANEVRAAAASAVAAFVGGRR